MKTDTLTIQVQDTMHELGNIGIGAAATALSSMLRRSIKTSTSTLKPIDHTYLSEETQMQDEVIGILFPFDKNIQGFGLFLLEKEFVEKILNNLAFSHSDFSNLDKESISILQEICSIMTSSYLEAISSETKLNIRIQLPAVSMDMKGSIINDGLSYILQQGQPSYRLDHEFSIENGCINHLMFMLPQECILTIMDALEVKLT